MDVSTDALLKIYHYCFQTFHVALILFNVFGWIPRPTARLNLITLVVTGLSWTVLGAFIGLGYCPLTDWHYGILERLGRDNLPVSYIAFLIEEIWSIRIATKTADWITGLTYALALLASVVRNLRISQALRQH